MVADGNLQDVLHFLIARAAQVLRVWRVSVWLFDDAREKIRSVAAYETTAKKFTSGEELSARDYPSYFAALDELRTIAAINAENDSRTDELRDTYLREHGITTMLDAPIILQGAVVGVVCHEHRGQMRDWTTLEKGFAGSIADFASLALAANKRLAVERELHQTAALLEAVTEQMSDGFCLLEFNHEKNEYFVRYVNQSGAEMAGYQPRELIGQPSKVFRSQTSVDLSEQVRRAAANNNLLTYETLTKRKDGTDLAVEIGLNVIQTQNPQLLAMVGRDISERHDRERERIETEVSRLQQQRLESLGLLAGKVAHDFNNLLVGVLGNLSLARREAAPDNDKLNRYFAHIETAANMAHDLCNQLLLFSGKQRLDATDVNLSELVAETSEMLATTLPDGIKLQIETEPDLPAISADATQIRQIILNLITNAAEAVAPHHGLIKINTGRATAVKLRSIELDVQAENFELNAAHVCLQVSDDGAGMDEATRRRIFEPFFTTKPQGHGLGLLTLVGIVRAYRGAIKVVSAPNAGTTFTVYFPETETK